MLEVECIAVPSCVNGVKNVSNTLWTIESWKAAQARIEALKCHNEVSFEDGVAIYVSIQDTIYINIPWPIVDFDGLRSAQVFSGCFPGGLEQEIQTSGRTCRLFRGEVAAVLELDRDTEATSAYRQSPGIRRNHSC